MTRATQNCTPGYGGRIGGREGALQGGFSGALGSAALANFGAAGSIAMVGIGAGMLGGRLDMVWAVMSIKLGIPVCRIGATRERTSVLIEIEKRAMSLTG